VISAALSFVIKLASPQLPFQAKMPPFRRKIGVLPWRDLIGQNTVAIAHPTRLAWEIGGPSIHQE
jgi:hypothetical protein